jgi:TonB family protein
VTACQTRKVSAIAALDEAACKFGLRLRFASTTIQHPAPLPLEIEWRASGARLVRAVYPVPPAIANDAPIVTEDDYPAAAQRAGAQGRTMTRLTVSVDGRATNCQIIRSSGSVDLDEATCRLFRARGRFSPARDEFGVPITAQVSQNIVWIIPPNAPATPTPETAKP